MPNNSEKNVASKIIRAMETEVDSINGPFYSKTEIVYNLCSLAYDEQNHLLIPQNILSILGHEEIIYNVSWEHVEVNFEREPGELESIARAKSGYISDFDVVVERLKTSIINIAEELNFIEMKNFTYPIRVLCPNKKEFQFDVEDEFSLIREMMCPEKLARACAKCRTRFTLNLKDGEIISVDLTSTQDNL